MKATTKEDFRFIDITEATDTNCERMLPVLTQLRDGITVHELRAVLSAPQGQRPRFTAMISADTDTCLAVAGWRLMANTHLGLVLYIDDLVVDASHRGKGLGHRMLAELEHVAGDLGAAAIDLDSGVQRSDAHRFYFANGFSISSHHFRRLLG